MDQQVEDRAVREKRESLEFACAFLFGAAASSPFWVLAGALVAAVKAWS